MYNKNMKNVEIFNHSTRSLIKKLNSVYKAGYVASRGDESYRQYIDDGYIRAGDLANCFEHACFNLKNNHFTELDLTPTEAVQGFGKYGGVLNDRNSADEEDIEEALFAIVKSVGLEYKLCSPSTLTKSNEWKVAFYLADDSTARLGYDFHFLLEEKNKTWTGKNGWYSHSVDTFNKLPSNYNSASGLNYRLRNVYKITNPFVEPEKE